MMYNDAIADAVQDMGYTGIMTEGVDWLMAGWRSPDFVYRSPGGLPVLLRNYRLSDDIGYRFSNTSWDGYPLTAEKFTGWLAGNTDPVVLLALDYEALGEHIWADTGIFDFLAALPGPDGPLSATGVGDAQPGHRPHRAQRPGGRADLLHDLLGRQRTRHQRVAGQRDAAVLLRGDQAPGVARPGHESADYLNVWRLMQTSDHLHYISDKGDERRQRAPILLGLRHRRGGVRAPAHGAVRPEAARGGV